MDQITARITSLREAAGLSESRLADNSAIPRTTFKRRLINPATFTLAEIESLAGVLGVDVGWLWLGDDAA
jgi:transcriptional regulator with XRE-family HTH domain